MFGTIRTAFAALFLDPTELNPNASHAPLRSNFDLLWNHKKQNYFKHGTRTGRFLAYFLSLPRLAALALRRLPAGEPGAVIAVADSVNQYRALEPLVRSLAASGLAVRLYADCPDGSTPPVPCTGGLKETLFCRSRFVAIPYVPVLLFRALTTRGYAGRSYRWALDEHLHAYGMYVVWRGWIRRHKPSAVLVSNDHVLRSCSLVKAARDENTPTFYLQHACVTDKFPPLRMDYALLDGRDALDKYAAAGPSRCEAYLTGMPRFDEHAESTNNSQHTERVGVCTSNADDLKRVEDLLKALCEADLGMEITLRPHPATEPRTHARLIQLCRELGIGTSPRSESAFAFLSRHDAVVSGVSAIVLEAALLNVTPLNYRTNETDVDWYGFLANRLCESFTSPESLVKHLRAIRDARPPSSDRAAYYCDTIGTPWHGRSTELATSVIAAALGEGNATGLQEVDWQAVDTPDGSLRAYGLPRDRRGSRGAD